MKRKLTDELLTNDDLLLTDFEDLETEEDQELDFDSVVDSVIAQYIKDKEDITQEDIFNMIQIISQKIGSKQMLESVPLMNKKDFEDYVKNIVSECNF